MSVAFPADFLLILWTSKWLHILGGASSGVIQWVLGQQRGVSNCKTAKKKQIEEQAAVILDAANGNHSANKIRWRAKAKAKAKASSDSGGSSEKIVMRSDDWKSNAGSPTFALNQIIAAINEVSSITSNYYIVWADKQDSKRMKYQVEEKWLAWRGRVEG